jgi:hypothetical protein
MCHQKRNDSMPLDVIAVFGKDVNLGRWKSSKIWSATSATLLYSLDVQVHLEPVCSALATGGLGQSRPRPRHSCTEGQPGPIFAPAIVWCGSHNLEVKDKGDRIFGMLKFLYLEANTGAEAEVGFFDKKKLLWTASFPSMAVWIVASTQILPLTGKGGVFMTNMEECQWMISPLWVNEVNYKVDCTTCN